jgi:hypothetical protein
MIAGKAKTRIPILVDIVTSIALCFLFVFVVEFVADTPIFKQKGSPIFVDPRSQMKISPLVATLIGVTVLSACTATGPRKTYEPFVIDESIPAADVEFRVHRFRNSASIHLRIEKPSDEGDELRIQRFGSLTNTDVGARNRAIKSLTVKFPADKSYRLFVDNTSDNGFLGAANDAKRPLY